ncbi:hypothetical protein K435DRAFT_871009 [Dendrothele bispora CBS 962.96]|uniref:Uncharacterized protein n=1 Tax=Dendrothele bispora (strain CBS 962.96) TaxID=1314807 RepID=A0A4S8L590_DENBC|nr:hypothetical protein K435DRAFT_871009 [Dendrothele bispora CBS 962.96]
MTSLGGITEARTQHHHHNAGGGGGGAPGSRRVSAHLQTGMGGRMGSKSPSSIPSSPTSVHSSSSAIFEPLVSISPLIHPHHSHTTHLHPQQQQSPVRPGLASDPNRAEEKILRSVRAGSRANGVLAWTLARLSSTSSTSPSSTTSTTTTTSKCLSFLSYTDILSSTPTSTLPLSSFTGAKGYGGEEPPHLLLNSLDALNNPTSVGGSSFGGIGGGFGGGGSSNAGSSSAGGSPPYSPLISPLVLGASAVSPLGLSINMGTAHTVGGASLSPSKSSSITGGAGSRAPSMRSGAVGVGSNNRDLLVMLEDLVGGEWEREGLGRGLEERLERIERLERLEGGLTRA